MRNVKIYSNFNRDIARTDDVQEALYRQARVLKSAAEARLVRHRKKGRHQITLAKGKTDHFVNLVGPGALSVETGWTTSDGVFVPGLSILKGLF